MSVASTSVGCPEDSFCPDYNTGTLPGIKETAATGLEARTQF